MFDINLTSRTPIYEQLYNRIVELIMKGSLVENDQLPSVRSLAKELGVNPNTVQKTYQMLEQNKIIYSLTGRGNFIMPPNPQLATKKAFDGFDQAARNALQVGISKEELIMHVKELSYD